jgi:hypothetical protein
MPSVMVISSGSSRREGTEVPVRFPNFLIIGAMRAGTTSATGYLRQHPEVFIPEQKEIHYFNREANFERGPEWYGQFFRQAGQARAVGEATPGYLYAREAPARMAQVVPDARLIAILRDPVDRAYSHYWHDRHRGRVSVPFEEAVARERERVGSPGSATVTQGSYLDRGFYLPQLERVCAHFDRSALLVLLFEDLVRDPGPAYASMCRHLGIDHRFEPPDLGRNLNLPGPPRSVRLHRYLRARRRTLPGRVAARLNAGKAAPYPPMDPAQRFDLVAHYVAQNRALAAWLGRDLSAWLA